MTLLALAPRTASTRRAFALSLALTAGLASSTASAETSGFATTGDQEIPAEITIVAEAGPYVADDAFEVTATVDEGSFMIDLVELLVDGEPLEMTCGADTATCTFEVTLTAGSHELQGRVTNEFGDPRVSQPLTVQVDEAGGTGGASSGSSGSAESEGSDEAESDEDSGCRIGGSGTPLALSMLALFGLVTRRKR
ncbi:MAG: MYXO-CTERM sorting domain-containing protein [Myxococcota bacterium]